MGLAEPLSPREPSTRARLVAAQLIRAQFSSMPTAFISNAVVSAVLAFTLRNSVPTPTWAGWLAVEYVWVVYRFWQWSSFQRAQPSPDVIDRWKRQVIIGS